jgi:hypothetical protein
LRCSASRLRRAGRVTAARTGTWLTLALVLAACSPRKTAPVDRAASLDSCPHASDRPAAASVSPLQIIPGRSAGPVTAASREVDLKLRYGAEAVRIELGEGETTPGTVLFARDSLMRAEIVWHDTVSRSRPARFILRGSRSKWTVGPGISLGTSLQELERINGRPFTLAGFGWDYAGAISEWGGGALDSALAGVKLYLYPGQAQYESASYSQVLGDRDYSSSLPPMQRLNPRVTQIYVDFE